MNNQDFQNICRTLKDRYENKKLDDQDVDAFADVVTNILHREDLRAAGTSYEELSSMISTYYEKNIEMNPLLARMYQICRMYENFRPRPLTEMERKEAQIEMSQNNKKKVPYLFTFMSGKKRVASCWWEDLCGIDKAMDCLCVIVDALPKATAPTIGDITSVLAKTGAGLDSLDQDGINAMSDDFGGVENVPIASKGEGIIAVDSAGVERNRARRSAEIQIVLDDNTVRLGTHTTYDVDFYRLLSGDQDFSAEGLEMLRPEDMEFSFENAFKIRDDWQNRLGDVFALEGSKHLVGVKKPLPLENMHR